MEDFKKLLTATIDEDPELKAGAELLSEFRKEFPRTAGLVLDAKRFIEAGSALKADAALIEEYKQWHVFLDDIWPELAKVMIKLDDFFEKEKKNFKVMTHVHALAAKELSGFITVMCFFYSMKHKREEILGLVKTDKEFYDTLKSRIPESELMAMSATAWMKIHYQGSGLSELLLMDMINEMFPPEKGGRGFEIL